MRWLPLIFCWVIFFKIAYWQFLNFQIFFWIHESETRDQNQAGSTKRKVCAVPCLVPQPHKLFFSRNVEALFIITYAQLYHYFRNFSAEFLSTNLLRISRILLLLFEIVPKERNYWVSYSLCRTGCFFSLFIFKCIVNSFFNRYKLNLCTRISCNYLVYCILHEPSTGRNIEFGFVLSRLTWWLREDLRCLSNFEIWIGNSTTQWKVCIIFV